MAITATSQRAAAGGGSVRARSRSGPAGGAQQQAPTRPGATDDWMASGAAAIQAQEEHKEVVAIRREERQAQMNVPFRFWLKKGEEADIVVLDDDFGPSVLEHDLTHVEGFRRNKPGTNHPQDIFVLSPQQWETDPLVEIVGKDPRRVTFLTIKDLRQIEKQNGEVTTNMYRLLPLMGDAFDMFVKIREQQIRAGHADKPLRGVQILMTRGNNDQSLRTGLPMFVARHSEQDIIDTFQHDEVRSDRDGRVLKEANAECYPIDYRAAFPKPSAEEIRRRFNLPDASAPVGSAANNRSFWGGSQETGQGASTEGYEQSGDVEGALDGGDYSQGFSTGRASGPKESYDLNDDIPF